METAAGEKRLQAVGVTGHAPVVELIDGQHLRKHADGSSVDLVSRPAGPGTPTDSKGGWSAADVDAIFKPRLKSLGRALLDDSDVGPSSWRRRALGWALD